MAIIKPEDYKGSSPYWWEVRKVDEDRFNNISRVTLSLYHSIEAFTKNKVNNILYEVAADVPGVGLTNDQITTWLVTNHDRFKSGTDVDGQYSVNTHVSPVLVEDSNPDPINGMKRTIEGIFYTAYLNADFVLYTLRAHFYPTIQIPDPENEGQFISHISDTYDSSLDKDFAWVVDNYDKFQDTGIGTLDYFKAMRGNGMTDNEILTSGIQFGLQTGLINKRLYGI